MCETVKLPISSISKKFLILIAVLGYRGINVKELSRNSLLQNKEYICHKENMQQTRDSYNKSGTTSVCFH